MGILDIFNKFDEAIVLKEYSSLDQKVKLLERKIKLHPNDKNLRENLYIAKKGLDGEKEILYQLTKSNIGMYILHDINIEYEDLKAQIDFIILTPWAGYFVECKNLLGNITVNEKGDFIREYTYKGHKVKKGMESPYRQVEAQREVYRKIWKRSQGKFRTFIFEKNFENIHRILVVAANGENILNTRYAPKDMKNNIIKADALIRKLEYDRDHSDKDLWDNQKGLQEWAQHFMRLNKNPEIDIDDLEEIVLEEEKMEKEPVIDISAYEENNDYSDDSINSEDELVESKISNIDNKSLKNTIYDEKTYKNKLREKLKEYRTLRAKEKGIPAYYVFNNEELEDIVQVHPKTLDELKKSKILKEVRFNSHGKGIVEIINSI